MNILFSLYYKPSSSSSVNSRARSQDSHISLERLNIFFSSLYSFHHYLCTISWCCCTCLCSIFAIIHCTSWVFFTGFWTELSCTDQIKGKQLTQTSINHLFLFVNKVKFFAKSLRQLSYTANFVGKIKPTLSHCFAFFI